MKLRAFFVILSLLTCVGLLFSGLEAAPAVAVSPMSAPSKIGPAGLLEEKVVVSFGGEEVRTYTNGPARSGYLGPTDHLQCMVYGVESRKIRQFKVKKHGVFSGNVKMLCGSATTSGYRHIAARHQKDWFKKLNWLKNKNVSGWDHYMFSAVKGALANPTKIKRQKGNKICYQGTVHRELWVNRKLKKKDSYTMKVILSTNHKRVITAYPGGTC